jgi:DNA repair protein RadC
MHTLIIPFENRKKIKMTTTTKLAEIEVSYRPKKVQHPIIKSSADAYSHLLKFFSDETISLQEQFVVGYVNRANRLMGVYEMSRGGITGTVADPKLILGVALKSAATGIILAHNHPSGNLQPSIQDKEITKKIQQACKLLDITMLDHLIVVPEASYFSFADEGLL